MYSLSLLREVRVAAHRFGGERGHARIFDIFGYLVVLLLDTTLRQLPVIALVCYG